VIPAGITAAGARLGAVRGATEAAPEHSELFLQKKVEKKAKIHYYIYRRQALRPRRAGRYK
jgi:hypothetical protein